MPSNAQSMSKNDFVVLPKETQGNQQEALKQQSQDNSLAAQKGYLTLSHHDANQKEY